jgi:DnaJ-domain-containing protein 1
MQIRSISDAKVLETYRVISSLRTDDPTMTRVKKNPARISDVARFSQEALDQLRLLNKAGEDDRIHQEAVRRKQDEELRRNFSILELAPNASRDEIKRAYYFLVLNYHPDRYSNLPPEFRELAENKVKQIIEAYNNLTK